MYKAKTLTKEDFTNYPNPVVKKSASKRKHTYLANKVQAIHSVCVLEDVACTEEEVRHVLNGGTTTNYMLAGYVDSTNRAVNYILGNTVGTANQVVEIATGIYRIVENLATPTVAPFETHSDYYGTWKEVKSNEGILKDLNFILSSYDTFANGYFRGTHPNTSSQGTVNLGNGETYYGVPQQKARSLALNPFKDLNQAKFSYFALALNYASAQPYYQVFFDGNKRTALFKANFELLNLGYNAIIIPPHLATDYNTALREMFTTGKISAYSDFLRSCYIDN